MNCKIGEKIRSLRLQQKMTQEQLADRLGISYQSVSRWENGVNYPDIEFLPVLAKCFSVSLDYLLGQDDGEKRKQILKELRKIGEMTESDTEKLLDLIRTCRREQDDGTYFERICCSLRYSPLWKNPNVLSELRKSKEIFFETCTDALLRSEALKYYVCLEEENYTGALLERYALNKPMTRDYLLKERYLFRDEFELFESARQRCFYKQIVYLIDGDMNLWRDTSKPLNAEYTLFENNAKLTLLHGLCDETPTKANPVTCGNSPDIFAEQRIFIGMRLACAYTAVGESDMAYIMLEEVINMLERIMSMPDGTTLGCTSPALDKLKLTVKEDDYTETAGRVKLLYYILENGECELLDPIFPKTDFELLTTAEYARWGWLGPLRKEKRFIDMLQRLEKIL